MELTERKVSTLVDMVLSGELLLPEIQREDVWTSTKVKDLVDSLYREYPSGSIMVWETDDDPESRSFATAPGGKALRRPLFVLDGQQRLSALTQVFQARVDLRFNIESEEFRLSNAGLRADPRWIGVADVLKGGPVGIFQRLQDIAIEISPDARLNRLNRLYSIRDYRYPLYVLHGIGYEEATEIFIRINSGGTRLRGSELAIAQLAFRLPGLVSKHFSRVIEELDEGGFGFRVPFLMRCLTATATGRSGFFTSRGVITARGSRLAALSPEEIEKAWLRTARSLHHTINLLRQNLGVESSDWLPSETALVPMVVFLARRPEPDALRPAETNALLHWFLAASIWSRYGAATETAMDQDLSRLSDPNPFPELLRNITQQSGRLDVSAQDLEGASRSGPLMLLFFLAARKAHATDWFTGVELTSTAVGPSHALEIHHVFPKALVQSRFDRRLVDEIGNTAFLSQKANRKLAGTPPERYLRNLVAERGQEVLRAQFIPLNEDLWVLDAFPAFLQARRELIANAINAFMHSLLQTDHSGLHKNFLNPNQGTRGDPRVDQGANE